VSHRMLVIAPHPDDETLGCGGTLLRAVADGASVHWAIATTMSEATGYDAARIAQRNQEIESVAKAYRFDSIHRGAFGTARLDTYPIAKRVEWMSSVISAVKPDTLFLPHPHDVHSDHAAVFDAAAACTKFFRYPYIQRVYGYETLSETEFGLRPGVPPFHPTRFVDITQQIEQKIEIMGIFAGEMGAAPFPRSADSIRALATYRGAVAGKLAAEAFMVLREIA
jgi:LmbE family N-acetylglucosaminyl deacetylase